MLAQDVEPDCLSTSRLCRWAWELTGQVWLAEGSDAVLLPLRILLIVGLALLARWLLRRAIDRLVRHTAVGNAPRVLRPLPERVRITVRQVASSRPARLRQRAQSIGSVLNSFMTIVVFSIASLLILSEFEIDLAPLLAGAGIVGVALGFGAQSLVKDLLAGLFILLEDQYGVGDEVEVGPTSGVVEAVGLRITTLRDTHGVFWYIPNGEIRRVGNRSQGATVGFVDLPIGFAPVAEATRVLRRANERFAEDPQASDGLVDPPELVGVHQVTVEGALVRTIVRTTPDTQSRIARELRRRQTEALAEAGLAPQTLDARIDPDEPGRIT
jgi:small conductance mechanosensitive channel